MSLEGRDKFCKMIQYWARFMKHQTEGTEFNVVYKGLQGKPYKTKS